MDKTNYFSILSQLQRVSSILPGEQENFAARTLHPTHYGRFCPIETPEGVEIGLRKNLAMLARISTRPEMPDEKIIQIIEAEGISKEFESDGRVDVFYNGRFLGHVESCEEFVQKIKIRGEQESFLRN